MGGDDDDAFRGEPYLVRWHAWVRWPAATYHTHPLPRSDQGCNTNHETNSRQHSPATSSVAECNYDGRNYTPNDSTNAKTTGKDHTRSVAVADAPANEVGVRLMT